jgi:predicted transcriptional regulator
MTKIGSSTAESLLPLSALEQAAECFKILAHAHRLHIVQLLLIGEYTVGELAEECGIPSHMASEHLKLMQRCGFLSSSRDGRKTYYKISEMHLESLMHCIRARFGSSTTSH